MTVFFAQIAGWSGLYKVLNEVSDSFFLPQIGYSSQSPDPVSYSRLLPTIVGWQWGWPLHTNQTPLTQLSPTLQFSPSPGKMSHSKPTDPYWWRFHQWPRWRCCRQKWTRGSGWLQESAWSLLQRMEGIHKSGVNTATRRATVSKIHIQTRKKKLLKKYKYLTTIPGLFHCTHAKFFFTFPFLPLSLYLYYLSHHQKFSPCFVPSDYKVFFFNHFMCFDLFRMSTINFVCVCVCA